MKIQNPETFRCRGGRAQDVGLFGVVCDERHDGGGDEAEGGDDPLPPRRAHQGAAPRGRERGEDTQPPLKGAFFNFLQAGLIYSSLNTMEGFAFEKA